MYKLYNIVKYDTNIKGYWKDTKGKIYIDDILVKNYDSINLFVSNKNYLYRQGEKAVFYIYKNKAYIEDNKGKKIILKNCIQYKVKRITKKYINELLQLHDGFTIFKHSQFFIIEVWKA